MVESTADTKPVEDKAETQTDADAKHPGKENENKKPREPTEEELKQIEKEASKPIKTFSDKGENALADN